MSKQKIVFGVQPTSDQADAPQEEEDAELVEEREKHKKRCEGWGEGCVVHHARMLFSYRHALEGSIASDKL